ncbi:hypothetical protein X943_003988 [Babesia divergens]|uniref:Uncharacterized protein n=1 Tax=Babesia divergens TaxID=32595 RepID=A0AAD9LII0_BABDI|nr:hypothetical protein X943_003988 [Babesia divergens]
MPLKLNEAITLFLSVRRGFETCLLNEIKRNPRLNCIERIHYKRTDTSNDLPSETQPDASNQLTSIIDLGSTRIKRYSDDKWLYIPNKEEPSVTRKDAPVTTQTQRIKYVDKCKIRLQAGGLEVKCNRKWLIGCVLGLRSVESVWLRVGIPFRCQDGLDVTHRISRLPWSQYLPPVPIEKIPLRIISRHSSVWSSVVIDECVREGIRSYLNSNPTAGTKSYIDPDDFCISVTINRNTCYVAVQCSSRLSPRHFNFGNKTSNIVPIKPKEELVPLWSLSKTKLQAYLEARQKVEATRTSNQGVIPPPLSAGENAARNNSLERKKFIENQNLICTDKYDTADVLVAGILHANSLFKALKKRPLRVWNPFCGNGLVISEIIALILQLPNFTAENPPSTLFRDLVLEKDIDLYNSVLEDHMKPEPQDTKDVEIVGSDTSLLNLSQAAAKLNNLYSFYSPLIDKVLRLPLAVSLHQVNLETIAPRMYGSTVITKIPCINKEAGTEHTYETIKAYRLFGNLIGSRSDWKGVFAIVGGRAFEYYSGLEWRCIAKANNARGGMIKLLRWTGKGKTFKSPEERLEQLNELDFV